MNEFIDPFSQHLAIEIAKAVIADLGITTDVHSGLNGARFYHAFARNPISDELRVTIAYSGGKIRADVAIITNSTNYTVESTEIVYDPNDPKLIDEIVKRTRRVLNGEHPHKYNGSDRLFLDKPSKIAR